MALALDRRTLLTGVLAGAGAAVLPWPAFADRAEAEAAIARLIGGAVPVPGPVAVVLPPLVEDGSSVALSVGVAAPPVPVVALHLIAPANPEPVIASIRLGEGARPELRTRIRLAASQTVRVLAVLADGRVWEGRQAVDVTVGGCIGAPPSGGEGGPVPRVRLPESVRVGEPVDIRTLIEHPMETGRRKGADGALVPRRILDAFTVSVGGRPVIEAAMGAGIAANPLIAVSILAAPGAQIEFVWHEEGGARFTLSRSLPAA